jgi:hypothetical protein
LIDAVEVCGGEKLIASSCRKERYTGCVDRVRPQPIAQPPPALAQRIRRFCQRQTARSDRLFGAAHHLLSRNRHYDGLLLATAAHFRCKSAGHLD